MTLIEKYLDKFGMIVQEDLDGGDCMADEGTYWFCSKLVPESYLQLDPFQRYENYRWLDLDLIYETTMRRLNYARGYLTGLSPGHLVLFPHELTAMTFGNVYRNLLNLEEGYLAFILEEGLGADFESFFDRFVEVFKVRVLFLEYRKRGFITN